MRGNAEVKSAGLQNNRQGGKDQTKWRGFSRRGCRKWGRSSWTSCFCSQSQDLFQACHFGSSIQLWLSSPTSKCNPGLPPSPSFLTVGRLVSERVFVFCCYKLTETVRLKICRQWKSDIFFIHSRLFIIRKERWCLHTALLLWDQLEKFFSAWDRDTKQGVEKARPASASSTNNEIDVKKSRALLKQLWTEERVKKTHL